MSKRDKVSKNAPPPDSELLWESFSKFSPYIIISMNRKRIILDINRVLKGYQKEKIIGQNGDQFVAPEYLSVHKKIIEKVFRTGKYDKLEIYAAGAKGKSTWYETIYIPVIKNKKVQSVTLITKDIAERKEEERKYFENKIGLDMILSQSPAFVWTTDKKLNITSINGSGLKKFNINADKSIGTSIYIFLGIQDKNNPVVKIHQLALKGQNSTEDIKIAGRYYHSHVEPFYNRDKKLSGVIGFAVDISERKEYELQLQKSRETYRNLVEYSPDGVFIHDEKGHVIFANSSALKIMGIKSLRELENKSVLHYILPEYHDEIKRRGKMLEEGKSIPFIANKIKRADGTIIDVESKPIPFMYEGKKAVLVVYHDISYQRQLEREQMRAQIAEEATSKLRTEITERKKAEEKIKQSLKEKEILLKEVHHRVKNNLQVISSILNLQSSYIKDKNMISLLKESQNRIQSMAHIHESLYQTKDFSFINFSEYIINLSRNLVHSYSSEMITIDLGLDVGNIFLNLDSAIPSGLIINELVSNSIKYAFVNRKSGIINIALKQEGDIITLKIADNGIGMPPIINFRKTESLGLQLVVTLVEQMYGNIQMENINGVSYTIQFKNKQEKHTK